MTGYRIEKRGYSVDPWRIITPGGDELSCPRVVHVHGADHIIHSSGHATKAAAVGFLGEYAWQLDQEARRRITEEIESAKKGGQR